MSAKQDAQVPPDVRYLRAFADSNEKGGEKESARVRARAADSVIEREKEKGLGSESKSESERARARENWNIFFDLPKIAFRPSILKHEQGPGLARMYYTQSCEEM